jgi:hypothetical protein
MVVFGLLSVAQYVVQGLMEIENYPGDVPFFGAVRVRKFGFWKWQEL